MTLFAQLIIPFIILGLASILFKAILIKKKHIVLHFLVTLTICSFFAFVQMLRSYNDTEVLTGVVTGKDTERTTCAHNGEHKYDIEWYVYFSTGERVKIDRRDPAGVLTPHRWDSTVIGEPASFLYQYKNHVKGAPYQLLKHTDKDGLKKYKDLLPEYPRKIYDYYRVSRFITVNFNPPKGTKNVVAAWANQHAVLNYYWNKEVSGMNSRIGIDKSANVILVLCKDLKQDYASALRAHWREGKKNDMLIIIGVDSAYHINWASVMAPADDEQFTNMLVKKITDLKNLADPKYDPEKNAKQFRDLVQPIIYKSYRRKIYSEIDYILMTAVPSAGVFLVTLFFNFLANVLLLFHYKKEQANNATT